MTALLQSAPVALPAAQSYEDGPPRVIGLDLSLTSTGVAGGGWAEELRPGPRRSHERMAWLRGHIHALTGGAHLVVVEGPLTHRAGRPDTTNSPACGGW